MKVYLYALMAFLSISLSACSTFSGSHVVQSRPIEKMTVTPAILEPAAPLSSVAFTVPVLELAQLPTPVFEEPLIVTPPRPVYSARDLECLSLAIYHEARGESKSGQVAVGFVVLNRTTSGKFPPTICSVVYQGTRKGCQFSWVCDRHSDIPRDAAAYQRAVSHATAVLANEVSNPVGKSLFFDGFVHRRQTANRPAGHYQIGNHRFYASYARR